MGLATEDLLVGVAVAFTGGSLGINEPMFVALEFIENLQTSDDRTVREPVQPDKVKIWPITRDAHLSCSAV